MVYPYEEILFLIRNTVLIHATTWMNLGNTVTSEKMPRHSAYVASFNL